MANETGMADGGMDARIGQRMIERMAALGMTQGRLAEALGLTQTAISRKLRGQRPWFSEELAAAGRVLGVSVAFLFGEDEVSPRDLDSLLAVA